MRQARPAIQGRVFLIVQEKQIFSVFTCVLFLGIALVWVKVADIDATI